MYTTIPETYITMADIYKVGSAVEINNFVHYWTHQGYRFFDHISVDKDMLTYAKDKKCLIEWLVENKYITKIEPFKPFTIEIPVNSDKEYWEVWHRMNINSKYFETYRDKIKLRGSRDTMIDFDNTNSTKLWRYVDERGKLHGTH